jgi:chemotaxis protein MotB
MKRGSRNLGWTWLLLLAGLLQAACGVPKKKFDAQTKEADEAKKQQKLADERAARSLKDLDAVKTELETRRKESTSATERATRADQTLETLKKEFATRIQASQEDVERLSKAHLEAEDQAKLLKKLTDRFQALIDAKQLQLKIVHGRMVLKLRSAVLFSTASADLQNAGKRTLKDIAKALKEIKDNHFQVAGHTDDNPIKSAKFPSNWELSTARGVAVVKFLQEEGVNGANLSAAGFAHFQPVFANSFKAGRQYNRRIEITLLPAIPSQLVKESPKAPAGPSPRK